jgi:type IV secretory pathway VirB2 component (pilin)
MSMSSVVRLRVSLTAAAVMPGAADFTSPQMPATTAVAALVPVKSWVKRLPAVIPGPLASLSQVVMPRPCPRSSVLGS